MMSISFSEAVARIIIGEIQSVPVIVIRVPVALCVQTRHPAEVQDRASQSLRSPNAVGIVPIARTIELQLVPTLTERQVRERSVSNLLIRGHRSSVSSGVKSYTNANRNVSKTQTGRDGASITPLMDMRASKLPTWREIPFLGNVDFHKARQEKWGLTSSDVDPSLISPDVICPIDHSSVSLPISLSPATSVNTMLLDKFDYDFSRDWISDIDIFITNWCNNWFLTILI